MNCLEAKKVSFEISGHSLVSQCSIKLEPGQLTALVGPNGAGKSTVLRLICGIWKPTSGSVALDGHALTSYGAKEIAQKIAFVPQDIKLDYGFTVREVVTMGRFPHEKRFGGLSKHDMNIVEKSMDRVDIAHLKNRYVTELSGGERQRVMLARCLSTEARYILLDEPTANLDMAHVLDVMELCADLADSGRAVVLAIHDLNSALRYANYAVLLVNGTTVMSGLTDQVLIPERIRDVFGIKSQQVEAQDGTAGFLFSRL